MRTKKVIKHILLIFILNFTFFINVEAFLDEDLGLNLYKSIDRGFEDLEIKTFEKEITGGGEGISIQDNLNRFVVMVYNLPACFNSNVEIKGKTDYITTSRVFSYIDESCLENNKISTSSINLYEIAINNFIQNSNNVSEEKAKQTYEISRIGLYTDGTTDNSPFDIIVDLQDIDNIIFGEKLEYAGEELGFLSSFKNSPLSLAINDKRDYENSLTGSNVNTGSTSTNQDGDTPSFGDNSPSFNGYKYDCDIDNSGLSIEDIKSLNLGNTNIPNSATGAIGGDSSHIPLPRTNKIDIPKFANTNLTPTGYSAINDNAVWPCNNFFCIKINFSTYNHKVLGYGETKSIEAVLEKSNEHLKKGVNTSLQQSKMATNNFEISLRDLDFPSQFHMGFVITKKSPPILNLENKLNHDANIKPKKDAKTGLDSELAKRLRESYKNLGLDYDRKNDINIFTKSDYHQKNLQESIELNPIFLEAKTEELRKIQAIKAKQNKYINNSLDKELTTDILNEFYLEFVELERFVSEIHDYTNSLSGLIKKLREISIYLD